MAWNTVSLPSPKVPVSTEVNTMIFEKPSKNTPTAASRSPFLNSGTRTPVSPMPRPR